MRSGLMSRFESANGLHVHEHGKAMFRFVKKVHLIRVCIDNRFVSAEGVRPVSDGAFRRLGKRMAEDGYVRG